MQKKPFDTYSAICETQKGLPGHRFSIVQTKWCCGKQITIQRNVLEDAEKMHNAAIRITEELNRISVKTFLSYRPSLLERVFRLADESGYILNRELFRDAMKGRKFPEVKALDITENRFIHTCKILEKYGVFYRVYGENFVSFVKGV